MFPEKRNSLFIILSRRLIRLWRNNSTRSGFSQFTLITLGAILAVGAISLIALTMSDHRILLTQITSTSHVNVQGYVLDKTTGAPWNGTPITIDPYGSYSTCGPSYSNQQTTCKTPPTNPYFAKSYVYSSNYARIKFTKPSSNKKLVMSLCYNNGLYNCTNHPLNSWCVPSQYSGYALIDLRNIKNPRPSFIDLHIGYIPQTNTSYPGCNANGVPLTGTNYQLQTSYDGDGDGNGNVTKQSSSPSIGSCGAGCDIYSSGTTVTLTASPSSGSTFSGWSGNCSGTGICPITMNSNKSATATFTSSSTGTYFWIEGKKIDKDSNLFSGTNAEVYAPRSGSTCGPSRSTQNNTRCIPSINPYYARTELYSGYYAMMYSKIPSGMDVAVSVCRDANGKLGCRTHPAQSYCKPAVITGPLAKFAIYKVPGETSDFADVWFKYVPTGTTLPACDAGGHPKTYAATSASSVAGVKKGDLNRDSFITITDGVLALRCATGLSPCASGAVDSNAYAAADCDGNGSVTITDGVNVLRAAAGLSSTCVTTAPTTSPSPTPPPSGSWTFCANENQFCSFTGTREVKYGANGSYRYGNYTGGVACNFTIFAGDPVVGVEKQCHFKNRENQYFGFETPLNNDIAITPYASQNQGTTFTPTLSRVNNNQKNGSYAIRIYGSDVSKTGDSYAYFKVYDFSASPIPIHWATWLSYWIKPNQVCLGGNCGSSSAVSKYVGVDLLLTDGTYLRDARVFDSEGIEMAPWAQGVRPNFNTGEYKAISGWIGGALAGKFIKEVIVAYHQPSSANINGLYDSYIDDIRITTLSAGSFKLDIVKSGEGAVTVTSVPAGIDCGTNCLAGAINPYSTVTLTSNAASYIRHGFWDEDCLNNEGRSGGSTCKLFLDSNKSIKMISSLKSYSLNLEVYGGGTVSSNPGGIWCPSDCWEGYKHGTQITLTPTPSSGYRFDRWHGADCAHAGTGACTMTLYDNNRTIQAYFVSLTTTPTPSGGDGAMTGTPRFVGVGTPYSPATIEISIDGTDEVITGQTFRARLWREDGYNETLLREAYVTGRGFIKFSITPGRYDLSLTYQDKQDLGWYEVDGSFDFDAIRHVCTNCFDHPADDYSTDSGVFTINANPFADVSFMILPSGGKLYKLSVPIMVDDIKSSISKISNDFSVYKKQFSQLFKQIEAFVLPKANAIPIIPTVENLIPWRNCALPAITANSSVYLPSYLNYNNNSLLQKVHNMRDKWVSAGASAGSRARLGTVLWTINNTEFPIEKKDRNNMISIVPDHTFFTQETKDDWAINDIRPENVLGYALPIYLWDPIRGISTIEVDIVMSYEAIKRLGGAHDSSTFALAFQNTLLHEYGHFLGLADSNNFTPSVMDYLFTPSWRASIDINEPTFLDKTKFAGLYVDCK